MPIPVRVAVFVPHDWDKARRVPTHGLALLVMVLIAMAFNPRQVVAQSDPRSPTDPSDPLKLLVDRLNDPQRGAALRAQWNVDRAVWAEPVTAVKNGGTVLVSPAHADIHTSIDSAGAVWSPDGPLISAPHNPTSARVFIPRGYQNQADGLVRPRRLVHGIHFRTEIRGPISCAERGIRSLCDQRLVHGCDSNSTGAMGTASQRSCRVCAEDVVGARPPSSNLYLRVG